MRKIISFLLCTAMVFLIGCSNSSSGGSNNIENTGNNLEDVIIGTWDVSWSRDEDYTFRNDGSIKISNNGSLGDFKYEIDGNMLYIYYTYGDYDFSDEEEEEYEVKEDKDGNYYVIRSRLEYAFEVEIISNDSLKLYEIKDDGTKTNVVEYMDLIS